MASICNNGHVYHYHLVPSKYQKSVKQKDEKKKEEERQNENVNKLLTFFLVATMLVDKNFLGRNAVRCVRSLQNLAVKWLRLVVSPFVDCFSLLSGQGVEYGGMILSLLRLCEMYCFLLVPIFEDRTYINTRLYIPRAKQSVRVVYRHYHQYCSVFQRLSWKLNFPSAL